MGQNNGYPPVTVMTLNWNNGDDLLACVEALKRLTYAALDILVVDNGSTDGSVARLAAAHPEIRIVENGRNLGYAEGVNVGLKCAFTGAAAYTLVINADTVAGPEALSELVKAAAEDEKIGLVTGKVYWYAQPDVLQTAGRYSDPTFLQGPHIGSGEVDRGQWDQAHDCDFVDDVFVLVNRSLYEQVGDYSTFFPVYWGISDLCARARRAGFRIVYTPASKIWHKGVIGNDNITLKPQRIFYIVAHQVRFMWRNASSRQFWAYLLGRLADLPRQFARYVKHRQFAELWAHARGISSGLFWLSRHRHGRLSG